MSRFFTWLVAVAAITAIAHGQPGDQPKLNPPKAAPPKTDSPAKDTTPEPKLIAKGETYLVHIVPATATTKDRPGRQMMITHTRRDAGEMTVLAETSGTYADFTRDFMTYSWDSHGIGGVRVDDERVYILAVHSVGMSTPAMGARGTTTAELRVFWLADGSLLGKWPVEGVQWPLFSDWERPTDAGLLRGTVNGVVVLGQAFVFEEKKLVSRVVDIPTEATAPVRLGPFADYRILAISPLPIPPGLAETKGRDAVGTSILYISPNRPAKTLLQTGDRPSAADGSPKGGVNQTRIVAVTWDTERLYVLVWHGRWERPGREMAVPRPLDHVAPSDDYRLYVFWLADGSDLMPVKVTAKEAKVPAETLRGDLLKEVPNGVKVFDETITYKGKERVK